MTKTNQPESKRKLIDLPVDVISILSEIAKERRMSLKAYIESLAIAAAMNSRKSNPDKLDITNININNQ